MNTAGVGRRLMTSRSPLPMPFWSTDSKTIAYFGTGGMYIVNAREGTPTLIYKSDVVAQKAGTWLEDGNIVFMDGGSGLLLIKPEPGASPKQLLAPPAAFPQALPGRKLLYWRGRGDSQGIYATT